MTTIDELREMSDAAVDERLAVLMGWKRRECGADGHHWVTPNGCLFNRISRYDLLDYAEIEIRMRGRRAMDIYVEAVERLVWYGSYDAFRVVTAAPRIRVRAAVFALEAGR